MVKYLLILLTPVLLRAQAHLGAPADEIMEYHPEVKWLRGITSDGTKYLMADMVLGRFIYYLDEYGISNLNLQVPFDIKCVNQQIAIYNEKYVQNGKTAWKAYLKNGYVMNIEMIWDEELKSFIFKYYE
jgi:hypothetical protein